MSLETYSVSVEADLSKLQKSLEKLSDNLNNMSAILEKKIGDKLEDGRDVQTGGKY